MTAILSWTSAVSTRTCQTKSMHIRRHPTDERASYTRVALVEWALNEAEATEREAHERSPRLSSVFAVRLISVCKRVKFTSSVSLRAFRCASSGYREVRTGAKRSRAFAPDTCITVTSASHVKRSIFNSVQSCLASVSDSPRAARLASTHGGCAERRHLRSRLPFCFLPDALKKVQREFWLYLISHLTMPPRKRRPASPKVSVTTQGQTVD